MRNRFFGRFVCVLVMVSFSTLVLADSGFAAPRSPQPGRGKPPSKALVAFRVPEARLAWKRVHGAPVPLRLMIGKDSFAFEKHGTLWGIRAPNRKMASLVPSFQAGVTNALVAASAERVRELVKGDATLARQVVNRHLLLTGKPIEPQEEEPAGDEEPGESAPKSAPPGAAKGARADAARGAASTQPDAVTSALATSLRGAYTKVMDQGSLFYPYPQPSGLGGWDMVEESSEAQNNNNNNNNAPGNNNPANNNQANGNENNADEESDTTFVSVLVGLILFAALFVAPWAIAVWAVANAVTVVGALALATAASSVMMAGVGLACGALFTVDNLLNGTPFMETWYSETHFGGAASAGEDLGEGDTLTPEQMSQLLNG